MDSRVGFNLVESDQHEKRIYLRCGYTIMQHELCKVFVPCSKEQAYTRTAARQAICDLFDGDEAVAENTFSMIDAGISAQREFLFSQERLKKNNIVV